MALIKIWSGRRLNSTVTDSNRFVLIVTVISVVFLLDMKIFIPYFCLFILFILKPITGFLNMYIAVELVDLEPLNYADTFTQFFVCVAAHTKSYLEDFYEYMKILGFLQS